MTIRVPLSFNLRTHKEGLAHAAVSSLGTLSAVLPSIAEATAPGRGTLRAYSASRRCSCARWASESLPLPTTDRSNYRYRFWFLQTRQVKSYMASTLQTRLHTNGRNSIRRAKRGTRHAPHRGRQWTTSSMGARSRNAIAEGPILRSLCAQSKEPLSEL